MCRPTLKKKCSYLEDLGREKEIKIEGREHICKVDTLKELEEDIVSSAWYQALPASPIRVHNSRSTRSRVSLSNTLNAPTPFPNRCVQNRKQSGVSGAVILFPLVTLEKVFTV